MFFLGTEPNRNEVDEIPNPFSLSKFFISMMLAICDACLDLLIWHLYGATFCCLEQRICVAFLETDIRVGTKTLITI